MKYTFDTIRFVLDVIMIVPAVIVASIVDDKDNLPCELAKEEGSKLTSAIEENNVRNVNTTTRVTTILKLFAMAH